MAGGLRFLSRWQNWVGLLLIGAVIAIAIAAPQIAPPADPDNPGRFKVVGRATDRIPHPPSEGAPLGTASGQVDMFYSVVWGTRSALRFGLTVTLLTATFGTLLGALSGYVGGLVNSVVMRITDAMLAFPVIAGVVLFRQVFTPSTPGQTLNALQVLFDKLGLDPFTVALVAFSWMPYARLTNALVLQIKQADFILASKSLGAGAPRMLFRHVLPNTISPALVLAARDVGLFVILEAAFTFIGIGGGGEWGALLAANRNWIVGIRGNPFTYWWVYLPPTVALILFGVGWNVLGDSLNAALNPRSDH
jgi:peptide/nickel transport system permease protein